MTTGTITHHLTNFDEDMPIMVERLISTAREKKMEEFVQFAARQASQAQANDPNNAEWYSAANHYGYSSEQWNSAVEIINGLYSEVLDWFMPFGSPNPDDFTELITSMAGVEASLEADDGIVQWATLAETDLGADWDGAFCNSLRNNFFAPLCSGITDNQALLATVLRHALEANQAIYHVARNDVFNIAQDGLGALGAIGEGDGGNTGLAILSAVIPIAGAVLTPITAGGSAVATGLALAGLQAAISVADNQFPARKDVYGLGAPTVDEVMANIVGALNKAWADIEAKETEIIRGLKLTYKQTMVARLDDNAGCGYRYMTPIAPALDTGDPTAGWVAD